MANWKSISQKEIDNIQELYKQGLNYNEIISKTGRSKATISRAVAPLVNHTEKEKDVKAKMLELRGQGLSNQQIAKEMNYSYSQVYNVIGKQPTGNRAEYGSVVAHVTGSSYVNTTLEKPKPVEKKPKAVLLEESVFRFKGKTCSYRVDSKGHVRILLNNGNYLDIPDPKSLFTMIDELADIGEFLLKMPQFSDVRRSEL